LGKYVENLQLLADQVQGNFYSHFFLPEGWQWDQDDKDNH
jgi:hypothetical protein